MRLVLRNLGSKHVCTFFKSHDSWVLLLFSFKDRPRYFFNPKMIVVEVALGYLSTLMALWNLR